MKDIYLFLGVWGSLSSNRMLCGMPTINPRNGFYDGFKMRNEFESLAPYKIVCVVGSGMKTLVLLESW
jgi:hypothetical protein